MFNTEFLNIMITVPTGIFSLFTIVFLAYFMMSFVSGGLEVFDFDVEIDTNSGGSGWLFFTRGISGVPLSIGLFMTFLIATTISFVFQKNVMGIFYDYNSPEFNAFDLIYVLISLAVSLPIMMASLWLAGVFIKKTHMAYLFETVSIKSLDYVGMKAKVSSGYVDSDFGVIVLNVGSDEFILNAYTDEKDIKQGDLVFIKEKNEERNKYYVSKNEF